MDNNQSNFNGFYQNNDMNQQINNSSNDSDKTEKYRKSLKNNAVVLLIISIIAIVVGITASGSTYEAGMNLFFRGLIYSILYIVLLANSKETKKFVGSFSIFTAIVVIVWSAIGGSLIDLALIILSVFNIVYAIIYLKSFKNSNTVTEISDDNSTNYYRLGSLIIILLSPLVWFLSAITDFYFGIVLLVIMNIISIILCVISNKKGKQSTLLYILMVISILIVLAYGFVLISDLIKGQNSLFGN